MNVILQYGVWTEFSQTTRAAVIGLSATPFSAGLGKIFTNLINATTMHELTESGVLVPMRIFAPHQARHDRGQDRRGELDRQGR
jgi:superfamily II DNA or RNA helicase